MKFVTYWLAVFTATSMAGAIDVEPLKPEQSPLLELNLVDGSHIVGVSSVETVPLETTYAKINLPLKQIRLIKFAPDRETVTFDLRNGDKLNGACKLESIKLTTVFGTVSIGIEHVRDLRVVLAGRSLPEALRRGLILYYSFDRDEEGRIGNQDGGCHDGTAMAGAKWTAEGKRGGGYRLTGGRGRVDVPDSPDFSLKPDEDKTFCLWWKKTGDLQHKILFSKHLQAHPRLGFALLTLFENGNRYYYLHLTADHLANYAANFSDDAWNHVAAVKSGTTWKVYHNGEEAHLARTQGWPVKLDVTVKAPLEIGGTHMDDYGLEGLVDEVMVFDRALSEEEIKQIYNMTESRSK